MKRALILVFLLFPLLSEAAKPSVDGSLKLSSAYLWRGDKVCGFHFTPDVCFRLGGFTLEHYSFLAMDGKYKEIDFDAYYTVGDFDFHIADYYFYGENLGNADYFTWAKAETSHVDEVAIVYHSSAIPLCAKWFTFFWGDWLPDGEGNRGRLSFSSFLELSTWYEFENIGTLSLNIGTSILKGMYTSYSRDFMPVHIDLSYSRSFPVGDFSLPVEAQIVFNPWLRKCYAGASTGIAF